MKHIIENEFNEHIKVANSLHKLNDMVASAAKICINCLKNGGKILIFGNGGSAADAQHIAAELVGRYKTKRQGLSAIALTTDTSALTSIGNDFGYEHIFDRQIEAIAKKNDVVIGISTSGESNNVVKALKLSSKLGCGTIGLSGQNGGEMNNICDLNIIAPSRDTPRIQEMHIIIGHTICHLIDQEFEN
ncbi:D-sedoheptulose 7-phosphate isomerase [Candidatus Pseudothioglobus singularis]|nr:D-sedoheptulose 7-phosphate isomerase [Candidatus Pseudothioglobus singularis]